MKKIIAIVLLLILTLGVFTGCSGKSDAVGKWYNSRNKCLDIRDDGTFKLDGEYGTGKWKKIDSENYEFYDFYGSVYEAELKNDNGKAYFDIEMYGDFYKGSYPEEANENNYDNSNDNDALSTKKPTETEPVLKELDAFDGLKIEASGISPFCTVAINSSGCHAYAQANVEYTLDKEYYANGDKVVITATMSGPGDSFYLSKTEESFDMPVMPEYITSVEGIDFSLLISERDDSVKANISSAIGQRGLFGIIAYDFNKLDAGNTFTSINSCEIKSEYFTSLKAIKRDTFNVSTNVFNSLHFIYEISASWEGNSGSGTDKMYTNFIAYNVVKYPDGSISWGVDNPDAYDFRYETTFNGVDDCVTTKIMCYSSDYNIEKVDIENKITN